MLIITQSGIYCMAYGLWETEEAPKVKLSSLEISMTNCKGKKMFSSNLCSVQVYNKSSGLFLFRLGTSC